MSDDELKVITSGDDLVEYYRSVNKDGSLYVGIEWERSGVYRDTLEPVKYDDDKGYLAVLKKLASEVGWEILSGYRNYILELQRGATKVTIESDGRLELAGSPQKNLHDLAREFRIHANEVAEVGNFFNIAWLPLGWQPLHNDEEITLMPSRRYEIFKKFTQNKWMDGYMKRNNGLTANFSFTDEENAIKKAQTAFRILPIVGAMFASSGLSEANLADVLDMRRNCVHEFFPGRTEMPKNILENDFSYKEWIEDYLDIPVILIKREGREDISPGGGFTFRNWIEKGYEGVFPTVHDFDQHIKTTWADIRLRPSYLEYRVADSVPFKMVMSVPALMKGLIFSSDNWNAVYELTKKWTYEDIIDLDRRAWKDGLNTEINGKKLLWYAQELITLANETLHKFGNTDLAHSDQGQDESVYLVPLKEQIYIKECSLAEEIRALWDGEWKQDPRRLIEWCEQN
jgi:glutamate--cysteine ligase